MKRLSVHHLDPAGDIGQSPVIGADGIVTWGNPSGGSSSGAFVGCKAVRSSTQSTISGAATAIEFTAADSYDTDALHDPASNASRITIPASFAIGVWRVTGSIAFSSASSSGYRMAIVQKNGADLPQGDGRMKTTTSGGVGTVVVTADVLASPGDYLQLVALQNSGGALNVDSATFAAHYLGAV